VSSHRLVNILLEWPVSEFVPPASVSLSQLFESIYGRLKDLSTLCMRAQPSGHTLQPTAVVHEAFLKLADRDPAEFKGQEHFMATAATVLRSVLVDHARRRHTKKRGSANWKGSADEFEPTDPTVEVGGLLALEDALKALAENDQRSARVAELRIFGGLSMEHVARLLDISLSTADRDWRVAKAWLEKEYEVNVRLLAREEAA
jgi:RNA polymerase sigma factor (TIGR02999 family)